LHCEIHDATQALEGRILKTLNFSERLPVYLVDRLHLSVPVTGDKYYIYIWSGSGGHSKLITPRGKFDAMKYEI